MPNHSLAIIDAIKSISESVDKNATVNYTVGEHTEKPVFTKQGIKKTLISIEICEKV